MSSAILGLRKAVASTLQGLTGSGGRLERVKVFEHGGEFDSVKELDRYSIHAPAVVIAILSIDGAQQGGQPVANVTMGAFVITVDAAKHDDQGYLRSVHERGEQALAVVDALLDYILRFPTKNWGVEAGKPLDVSARNLYDERFDARNAACWGVFWNQTVDLVTTPGPVLDDFSGVDIVYDIEDRPDGAELGEEPEAEDFAGEPPPEPPEEP